jgi:hypothetical protein
MLRSKTVNFVFVFVIVQKYLADVTQAPLISKYLTYSQG